MANPIQNRWAFLVGVNRYRERQLFPELHHCVNDVKALQNLLKQVGYAVVCLHDELDSNDPRFPNTGQNIKAELRRLCQNVGPDDLLLTYFACHGTRQIGDDGRICDHGKPRLVARETRSTLPETALLVSDIEAEMRASGAQRLVMMLDACHMGAGIDERGISADPTFIQNVYELATGFALLTASTSNQTAKESQVLQHGVFSNAILAGLAGEAMVSDADANQNFVTVDSLKHYVFHSLKVSSVESGFSQTPQGRADGDLGSIMLVDYRQQAKPTVKGLNSEPGGSVEVNLDRGARDSAPMDRLEFFRTLSALTPTEFDGLLFTIKPPAGIVPGSEAASGSRVSALLGWAEGPTGCGLEQLQQTLKAIVAPQPSQPAPIAPELSSAERLQRDNLKAQLAQKTKEYEAESKKLLHQDGADYTRTKTYTEQLLEDIKKLDKELKDLGHEK